MARHLLLKFRFENNNLSLFTCQKGKHKASEGPDGTTQGAVIAVLKPFKRIKLTRPRETCEHIVITELDRTAKIN